MSDPKERRPFKVIIAGAGIAGLTLANALQHANIDYLLLEARNELAPQVGASIGLFSIGGRILDQLNCWDVLDEIACPITLAASHKPNGELLGRPLDGPRLGLVRTGYNICFVDRQLVLEELANHIQDQKKVLCNKRVASVDHSSDHVTVHCTDGTKYEGSVVIGADGVNSIIRHEMWRLADSAKPEMMKEDRKALKTEYKCLYGISSHIPALTPGTYEVTHSKDLSTMVIPGRDRAYFFIFKRLDRVYGSHEIPKFTREDAETFAKEAGGVKIHAAAGDDLPFSDLWDKRTSFALVSTEEGEYKHWSWGRIMCLGDAIHKITPNAGMGGNAAIETAAVLANALYKLTQDPSRGTPTLAEIRQAFEGVHKRRLVRWPEMAKGSNRLTRIHALRTFADWVMYRWVIPNAGDHLVDMNTNMSVGADMLDYLPVPERSLHSTMPFNPVAGLGFRESILRRAFVALPFLVLVPLATHYIFTLNIQAAMPWIQTTLENGVIELPGGSLPLRKSFVGLKSIDDLTRLLSVFFAPSTFALDEISWWQAVSFFADVGVFYTIWLIESARRANLLTFAEIPILFAFAGQTLGLGRVAPVYYFLHYIASQMDNFKASDHRLTSMAYTRSVLPAVLIGYYLPLAGMYLAAAPTTRHLCTIAWQIFPIYIAAVQWAAKKTGLSKDTVDADRLKAPTVDIPWIRFAVTSTAAISSAIWLSTLTRSGFSPLALFVPSSTPTVHHYDAIRSFMQSDALFVGLSTYLWLIYLFVDLHRAGMFGTSQEWAMYVGWMMFGTALGGPGCAVAGAWLWRESLLVERRHWAAITPETVGRVKNGMVVRDGREMNGNGNGKVANGKMK